MTNELSLAELESELCAELPTRNLMRRRRLRFFKRSFRFSHERFERCDCERFGGERFNNFGGGGEFFGGGGGFFGGSAFASNETFQSNFNPQVLVNNGFSGGGSISSFNSNFNATSQFVSPVNIGGEFFGG